VQNHSPISVFFSYAYEDEPLLQKLEMHLSVLKQQGLISTWDARQIVPGTNWAQVIDERLELAEIILLLVSTNFLASDYCYQVEMKRALERHEAGQARVIPIIVRPCDWSHAPFTHLQKLPTGSRPIVRWPDRDEAWTNVVQGIRRAIEDFSSLSANTTRMALSAPGSKELVSDAKNAEMRRVTNQQIAQGQDFGNRSTIIPHLNATRSSAQLRPARFGEPFPAIWNVFRRHNPFFTGRDYVLEQLFDGFNLENVAGMISPQAVTGLGGMGKTQTAAEYAYRFRKDYRAVLWVRAETQENILADFKTIAGMLKLPQEHMLDRTSLVQAMKEWFMNQSDWLLIFDNADNPALVDPCLPRATQGHLLLTTRAGAIVEQAQPLRLEPLNLEDGALCILRRAGILAWNKPLDDAPLASVDAARQLAQLMDGLPLALEQAGAYINDTECGVRRYLNLYQQYRSEIQRFHHGTVPDYPESVASAWSVSRSIVEQINPAATELLRLCTYLAPETIPDELVTKGAAALGPVLGPVAANPVALDQTIGLLRKYSLLNREADRTTDLTRLSIHRVMQEILLDEMEEVLQYLWAERAVRALAQALPVMEWSVLQAHVRHCLDLITKWHMSFPEAELIRRYAGEI
jgi:TIR domain/NB-ARC domain